MVVGDSPLVMDRGMLLLVVRRNQGPSVWRNDAIIPKVRNLIHGFDKSNTTTYGDCLINLL